MEKLKFANIKNDTIYSFLPKDKQPKCIHTTEVVTAQNGVPVIRFPLLLSETFVEHAFSTRIGGVSTGIYESMNLSFNLDDKPENVSENFKRMAQAVNTVSENMVYSKQTHTINVLRADKCHAGMGVVRERDFDNTDGLVTNVPGLCLVTSYADCIPLFFADSVTKSIGLSHSGWRGTIGNIAAETICKMQSEYGSNAEDIKVVIGPGICRDCYEVGADVAERFLKQYASKESCHIVTGGKTEGKYQLNLQLANYYNLIHAGISPQNIAVADICTCCNSQLLFSHRATKGRRGILCGMMYIK